MKQPINKNKQLKDLYAREQVIIKDIYHLQSVKIGALQEEYNKADKAIKVETDKARKNTLKRIDHFNRIMKEKGQLLYHYQKQIKQLMGVKTK